MTRILGIDPGSHITGFGVIEARGGRIVYVTSGCVRAEGDDLATRLKSIYDGVAEIAAEFRPDQVAVERVFVRRNIDSALKLGQARGSAICAVAGRGLVVFEYTPAQIKQAIVGRGNAGKEQIQFMVRTLLKLPGVPQADAADALACALCHRHAGQTLRHVHKAAVS